jgi:enoyl-CoA hydratase/carnithine racemase
MPGNSAGIMWIEHPDKLARNIRAYGSRVFSAIHELAQYIAAQAEGDMRRDASWTDRTGLARSSLRGIAERAAEDIVVIYLIHGAPYGKHLELSMQQRYAIIAPTMQRYFPEIRKKLQALLD